jgi:hypothetical protein
LGQFVTAHLKVLLLKTYEVTNTFKRVNFQIIIFDRNF